MADLASMQELQEKTTANTRYDGYGLDTCIVLPCPFCAAPDWGRLYSFAGLVPGDDRPNIDDQMREERTCASCGRSAKCLVDRGPVSVSFEIVQTGGSAQPEWMVPPMRRVDR